MNATDFIAAGYKVSNLIQQPEIDRACKDAREAYVAKVTDADDDDTKAAVMAVAFILLCARNTFATRSGGKTKVAPSLSTAGNLTESDYANADRLLRKLQAKEGAAQGDLAAIVDDIAQIYFRNVFF